MGDRHRTLCSLGSLLLVQGCGTTAPPPCAAGSDCHRGTDGPVRVVDLTDRSSPGTAPSRGMPDDPPSGPGEGAVTVTVPAGEGTKGPFPVSNHPDLRDPTRASRVAPSTYRIRFETTQGNVDLDCFRAWAPHGADRLFSLVTVGFFDDVAFFRTISGFMTQFGIHGVPDVNQAWKQAPIPPDPVTESNLRGRLSFAQAKRPTLPGHTADDRTTQLFINTQDNPNLDSLGFAPVCDVVQGMDVLEALHSGDHRAGRDQANILREGNPYLRQTYPQLDYIIQARITASRP